MLIYQTAAIAIGVCLDFIIGDPQWIYHPIRLIGWLIMHMERILRRVFPKNSSGELCAGVVLALSVTVVTGLCAFSLCFAAYKINWVLYVCTEAVLCYFLLAAKSLKTESMKVYSKLEKNDIEGARYAVSMIVGRDTKTLDKTGIIKAAVETVAENTSDGVIAPLFYMALGGPVLGFMYKAINTLDSMVGYKNENYLYFGRFSAKLDDIVNYIPARLSAWLMIFAAFVCRFDAKNALKMYCRDKYNHASPNSAHTEAVCAGALDVRLAGDAYYFGKLYKKKFIGDDIRPIENEDIKRANRLMYVCTAAALVIAMLIRAAFILGGILS
ncbi:MAG: adenosylcobinamide-phosphate synthase CbiB [Monoglobales bacterium]